MRSWFQLTSTADFPATQGFRFTGELLTSSFFFDISISGQRLRRRREQQQQQQQQQQQLQQQQQQQQQQLQAHRIHSVSKKI